MRHESHGQVRPRVRRAHAKNGVRGLSPITLRGQEYISNGVRVKSKLCAFDPRLRLSLSFFSAPVYKHTNARNYTGVAGRQCKNALLYAGGKCRIIASGILSRDVFFLPHLPPHNPDVDVIFRERGSYFRAPFPGFLQEAFN